MVLTLKKTAAALALTLLGTTASAATFNSVDGTGKSWTLDFVGGSIVAFDEANNIVSDGLAGTLGASGDAIKVKGSGADVTVNGDAAEASFLKSIAALFGDTMVAGSFDKDDDGYDASDANAAFDDVTIAVGDYVMWKSSTYVGVAKVLALGTNWTFSGRHDISHFSKISTTSGGGGTVPGVPVPASLPLLAGGLGLAAFALRRRKS